jgi:hypothetical protein
MESKTTKICRYLNLDDNPFTPNLGQESEGAAVSTTIVAMSAVRNTSASGLDKETVVHQSIPMLSTIKREVLTYCTLFSSISLQ